MPALQKAQTVWERFTALDVDGDGMLTAEELALVRPSTSRIGSSTMTREFLRRVLEVHVTGTSPVNREQAMSLEDFADFLLAWNLRGEPASNKCVIGYTVPSHGFYLFRAAIQTVFASDCVNLLRAMLQATLATVCGCLHKQVTVPVLCHCAGTMTATSASGSKLCG
jgi:hypothetical protein